MQTCVRDGEGAGAAGSRPHGERRPGGEIAKWEKEDFGLGRRFHPFTQPPEVRSRLHGHRSGRTPRAAGMGGGGFDVCNMVHHTGEEQRDEEVCYAKSKARCHVKQSALQDRRKSCAARTCASVHPVPGSGLTSGVHAVLLGCSKAQRWLVSVPENILGFSCSLPICSSWLRDHRRFLCTHPMTLKAAVEIRKSCLGGLGVHRRPTRPSDLSLCISCHRL